MSANIEALYDPELGQVGCVLLQAAFKLDRRVCNIFDARDWFVAPTKDMIKLSATIAQWEQVAAMSREERVERWKRFSPATKPNPIPNTAASKDPAAGNSRPPCVIEAVGMENNRD